MAAGVMIMTTFISDDLLFICSLCTVHCALCPWCSKGGFLTMGRKWFAPDPSKTTLMGKRTPSWRILLVDFRDFWRYKSGWR